MHQIKNLILEIQNGEKIQETGVYSFIEESTLTNSLRGDNEEDKDTPPCSWIKKEDTGEETKALRLKQRRWGREVQNLWQRRGEGELYVSESDHRNQNGDDDLRMKENGYTWLLICGSWWHVLVFQNQKMNSNSTTNYSFDLGNTSLNRFENKRRQKE